MKKVTALFIALVLTLSILPINVSATETEYDIYGGIDISKYTNSELDLSQYTMDDLINMSNAEYMNLLAEFERVYDPYDSYVELPALEDNSMVSVMAENVVSPQWTSGNINVWNEYTEAGCHEGITAKACEILINDKGFFAADATSAVVITLSISLASLLPDKDEIGYSFYAGHFYDPDTNTNYDGLTTNTAKTNAVAHYNTAVQAARDGDAATAFEYLGRCLHYVQDANEPHHAANDIASIGLLTPHGAFEAYAFDNMDTFLSNYNSIANSYYTTATSTSVTILTHNAAVEAKSHFEDVRSAIFRTNWPDAADACLKNAARYSAMIMYRFAVKSNISFYYN